MTTDTKRFILLDLPIAGAPHHMREDEAMLLKEGTPLTLHPEPSNAYDANAIRLNLPGGRKAGYIGRTLAPMVGALLSNGYDVQAAVTYVSPGAGRTAFTVAIALSLPALV
jgi:hypothetical protein